MRKKIITAGFIVLLLFIGIIALTQETGKSPPGHASNERNDDAEEEDEIDIYQENDELSEESQTSDEIPEWVKPARWFRSNAGGMALEEIQSRYAALRNEYALVIDFADSEELPHYLLPYFEDQFFTEIRRLYKNTEETRVQWIFRDRKGTARLIAVLFEPENKDNDFIEEKETELENMSANAPLEEDEISPDEDSGEKTLSGFIEIYNEMGLCTLELKFFDDGAKNKIEYSYNKGFMTSAAVFSAGGEEDFSKLYADFFRYNRSSYLRSVERVFYQDMQISPSEHSVIINFPYRIFESAKNDNFIGEQFNQYPEYFGDVSADQDSKIIYTTDNRGRILTQTMYGKDEKVIWSIVNAWNGDRIESILRTEGDMEHLAEYEYDLKGNRILERNYKNGILERLVRTEDGMDYEELYLNGVVVLRAVWEDGRKISENWVR
ncbi:MAG: hypothetical protein LBH16_09700 [Treponema sp.]|jgi:hypothetical protein|nr:hypothetical protein [Treponema sp.]